jgi:streptogramin lyase
MISYYSKSIAFYTRILLLLCLFTACSKSATSPSSAPTITGISVNKGPYDMLVGIIGSGFSLTFADNKVFFNGKQAVLEAYSPTELYARVPLGAGTGNVTLSVTGSSTVSGPVFTYQPGEIVAPFAGSGSTSATNGPGASAGFNQPYGLATDAAGNIYVADEFHNMIREITPAGVVSTIAGSGAIGAANGPGNSATFNEPTGVAVDNAGNIYVADYGNNLIRKITAAGVVSTLAGNGIVGYADGIGRAVMFSSPFDLVVDANGNLYITDTYNFRIRKITPAGVVSTFAGNNSGLSQDCTGTAASFAAPYGIAIDAAGNLYVSQADNLVRKITPGAAVTTIGGTISPLMSQFEQPRGMAVDKNGDLLIDCGYKIEEINTSGQVSTFAGSGATTVTYGPALTAGFSYLEGIAIDNSGNIYISQGNLISKIFVE